VKSESEFFGHEHVTVIEPQRGWRTLDLKELWAYRELLNVLALRDIKVRYEQTVLGVAWAVIQPLLTMILFSVVFGRQAKIPSDGLPYPIFVYAGLLPWTFFAGRGRVVYQYKHPFRDGSTHVILEPLACSLPTSSTGPGSCRGAHGARWIPTSRWPP
jgi:hypothetical protein